MRRMKSVYLDTEVDIEFDIEPNDLTYSLVKNWVHDEASLEDREALRADLDSSGGKKNALELLYQEGKLSLWDVMEFLKNHSTDIDLHNKVFIGS